MRLLRLEAALAVPSRPYRRARAAHPDDLALVGVALILVEGALVTWLGQAAAAWSRAALTLAQLAGTPATLGEDHFLGVALAPLDFPMAAPTRGTHALWLAGALGGLLALSRLRRLALPLRLLAGYGLILVGAAALHLLSVGPLGYDAPAFSRLYLRTMVLVWLTAPVLTAAVAVALPLPPGIRVAAVVVPLLYDLVLSGVRYALFAWALALAGSVLMPGFYLALGPLLDAVVLVSILVLFLPGAAARLDRERHGWRW